MEWLWFIAKNSALGGASRIATMSASRRRSIAMMVNFAVSGCLWWVQASGIE
ncbi:hypothetical protein [Kingella oralis]|uniref:hypothetical protein n=1 Tax=Kingella oralis TaxID=505 RepID=UPI0034E37695